MAVLGVITCQILELEFAYLLSNDTDVAGVTVLENANSFGLIESLISGGRLTPRRIPILKGWTPADPDRLEVLVMVLELALHNRKRTLQDGLIKAVKEMGRLVDAIVLGYGLCGNALQKPEELFSHPGPPIFIPMDTDHPVDDCVGLIIGGREKYYGEQCRVAGTFFMIPGWTRHWKNILVKDHGRFDPTFAKRLFEMAHYERSLLIPNPALPEETLRENIEEFTRLFGFRIEVRPGTLDILTNTWEKAKSYLRNREAAVDLG